MKKLALAILLLASALFLQGCGKVVEVPPAHVGKILTKNGFQPDIVPPSKFRLPFCIAYCDKLIVLQATDNKIYEKMELFMPKDKLVLKVDVRGTYSVSNDVKTVNTLFSRVTPKVVNGYDAHGVILARDVYAIYGQQAIRGIVRSQLSNYTIGEILSNRDAISQKIQEAITKKLKATHTPIIISRLELANITPPDVIVKAQEAAKKREIAIQQAEADAKVKMVEAERALEVAKKQRLVEREKALAIAEQNRIAAKSVTPELIKYRQLEIAEKVLLSFAENKSDNLIVLPVDMSSLNTASDSAVLGKVLGKTIPKK